MNAVDSLQSCLAAEHAAVYGYGVLGGVLAVAAPGSANSRLAVLSYQAHRRQRDSLTELIARLGATPVAAKPSYATPFRVNDVGSCRRLARLIEDRVTAPYGVAVASTTGQARRSWAVAMSECAVRRGDWGGKPEALPGLGRP
ncbi:MAG: ferritin-like domain-containing protein [Nocardioidaceae bacterium]